MRGLGSVKLYLGRMTGSWRTTADEDGHYSFAVALDAATAQAIRGRITRDGLQSCATPHGRTRTA
jgi:hypothetical protein